MKKILFSKIDMLLRMGVFVLLVVEIFLASNLSDKRKWELFATLIILLVNDFLRKIRLCRGKTSWIFTVSLGLSIIGGGLFEYWIQTLPADIYFIIPLVEIIVDRIKIPYELLGIHAFVFALVQYLQRSNNFHNVLLYGAILLLLFLFRTNRVEKEKVEKLNIELRTKNQKLEEYAQTVRKTTQMEERTRLAQDLHDSIGHGLVALEMNLEFALNCIGRNPEKTRKAVETAFEYSKSCLSNLRRAVSVLKDSTTTPANGLRSSIEELFSGMHSGGVEFRLELDESSEHANPEIQDCIYKTIREAVTNGVCHGKANRFDIMVAANDESLTVTIQDDGIGCGSIIKSHGLFGIEKRVTIFGGQVCFASPAGGGFLVKAQIPFTDDREGETLD